MCDFCLPSGSKLWCTALKVDKNRGKCVNLSTGWFKFRARGLESRQKPGEMCDFCLPSGPKLWCSDLKVDKNRGKCVNFVYRLVQNCGART